MVDDKKDKIKRVLEIYSRLLNGSFVNKRDEAARYGVNERSIQRDIDDIRGFLETDMRAAEPGGTVVYDRAARGYRLEENGRLQLSDSEILALCKILLDSRAFPKAEMSDLLDRLISCCVPRESRKLVKEMVGNEMFHYIELQHATPFLDTMWEIAGAIRSCQYIEIEYGKIKDRAVVKRKVQPVALLFSEYYFYLTAFITDSEVRKNFDIVNDSFPTIYRIDRIRELKVLEEHFHIPYSSRFEEGEFRKRIQFMYGGKLQKVKFKYRGENVEAILDRLPTAKILEEEDGVYTLSAEVFGKGIDMWLRSQGDSVFDVKIS
ncbi:MAG: WYL domain-containing protein [Lachnospiraceae bacterium]|nr:WYL domain-containing protein [uncultured Acetatifactor sp.]MCI9571255.1 WYL domain-containing protein [Lachnospiraceae bacterium]